MPFSNVFFKIKDVVKLKTFLRLWFGQQSTVGDVFELFSYQAYFVKRA